MKTPVLKSLFHKVVGLQLNQKQTSAQIFSCEYREIFSNTCFEKDMQMVAFVHLYCFIHYHFPNLCRVITSCSALVTA